MTATIIVPDLQTEIDSWLIAAEEMISLCLADPRNLSKEEREELILKLNSQLRSGEHLAKASDSVLIAGIALFFHLGILYGIQGDWTVAAQYVQQAEHIADECASRREAVKSPDATFFALVRDHMKNHSLPFAEARAILQVGQNQIYDGA